LPKNNLFADDEDDERESKFIKVIMSYRYVY